MIETWTLPRAERNSIYARMTQLNIAIGKRAEEINGLTAWLNNLNAMQAADKKKLQEIKDKYKV